MNTIRLALAVCLTCPSAAIAQDTLVGVVDVEQSARTETAIIQTAQEGAEPGAVHKFASDVAHDYRNFFSWNNAAWLGAGGLASLAVHPADEPIHEWVLESGTPPLPGEGGSIYGSQVLQVPVAVLWWIIGNAAGSERGAVAGRDMLRAQISVFSWTYVVKYAADRTRPNGDPRSFPSGHASTSFAMAMVLQEDYGWKLGVPAFVASTYTAASRVTDNQHWLSDVVFGAVLGMVSGRTVTVRLRDKRLKLVPLVVPGGGGISFSEAR